MATPSPIVLVLDDDPAIRDSTGRLLRTYGYSPVTASTLDEATRALRDAHVDALIIDVRLADGTTGLDLLHLIRERPEFARVPVLVFTGAVLSEPEEALITRLRGYLFHKPEGLHALLQFLDTLTGRDQEH